MNPREAAHRALTLLEDSVEVGLIILTKNEFTAQAKNSIAWSHLTET
ncbi:MAG: hypothetical protein KJ950_05755 [Proteobacteria bacterium]|nr:hypothetical protein [Pseudomonadota bacterium]MBU1687418.1 hypothetical protein [Pseudomonadota bacterium]